MASSVRRDGSKKEQEEEEGKKEGGREGGKEAEGSMAAPRAVELGTKS